MVSWEVVEFSEVVEVGDVGKVAEVVEVGDRVMLVRLWSW